MTGHIRRQSFPEFAAPRRQKSLPFELAPAPASPLPSRSCSAPPRKRRTRAMCPPTPSIEALMQTDFAGASVDPVFGLHSRAMLSQLTQAAPLVANDQNTPSPRRKSSFRGVSPNRGFKKVRLNEPLTISPTGLNDIQDDEIGWRHCPDEISSRFHKNTSEKVVRIVDDNELGLITEEDASSLIDFLESRRPAPSTKTREVSSNDEDKHFRSGDMSHRDSSFGPTNFREPIFIDTDLRDNNFAVSCAKLDNRESLFRERNVSLGDRDMKAEFLALGRAVLSDWHGAHPRRLNDLQELCRLLEHCPKDQLHLHPPEELDSVMKKLEETTRFATRDRAGRPPAVAELVDFTLQRFCDSILAMMPHCSYQPTAVPIGISVKNNVPGRQPASPMIRQIPCRKDFPFVANPLWEASSRLCSPRRGNSHPGSLTRPEFSPIQTPYRRGGILGSPPLITTPSDGQSLSLSPASPNPMSPPAWRQDLLPGQRLIINDPNAPSRILQRQDTVSPSNVVLSPSNYASVREAWKLKAAQTVKKSTREHGIHKSKTSRKNKGSESEDKPHMEAKTENKGNKDAERRAGGFNLARVDDNLVKQMDVAAASLRVCETQESMTEDATSDHSLIPEREVPVQSRIETLLQEEDCRPTPQQFERSLECVLRSTAKPPHPQPLEISAVQTILSAGSPSAPALLSPGLTSSQIHLSSSLTQTPASEQSPPPPVPPPTESLPAELPPALSNTHSQTSCPPQHPSQANAVPVASASNSSPAERALSPALPTLVVSNTPLSPETPDTTQLNASADTTASKPRPSTLTILRQSNCGDEYPLDRKFPAKAPSQADKECLIRETDITLRETEKAINQAKRALLERAQKDSVEMVEGPDLPSGSILIADKSVSDIDEMAIKSTTSRLNSYAGPVVLVLVCDLENPRLISLPRNMVEDVPEHKLTLSSNRLALKECARRAHNLYRPSARKALPPTGVSRNTSSSLRGRASTPRNARSTLVTRSSPRDSSLDLPRATLAPVPRSSARAALPPRAPTSSRPSAALPKRASVMACHKLGPRPEKPTWEHKREDAKKKKV
eukprot:Gregarina_sp_Poly_1__2213@NODE_1590_length_3773_cov_32_589045_g319_i1_p1_GENE_NODE_1590_length_3773_cov_32_589045_g319_i1NODE_1590_length_3773_cov_32_589045_g319_i1_p1_ORF_typecomplete_len1069_score173_60DUF2428/PF10350_9/0_051_NODE_1590_length_3773_cov_32_589045_g319_i14013607